MIEKGEMPVLRMNRFDESNPYLTPILILPPQKGRRFRSLVLSLQWGGDLRNKKGDRLFF